MKNKKNKTKAIGAGNCGCGSSSKSRRLQHEDYLDNLYKRAFADKPDPDPVPVIPCDCGRLTEKQIKERDKLIKKCEESGTAEWVEPTSGWCEDNCTGDCFGEVICTTPSSPSGTARTIRTPCSQSKGVLPIDAGSHPDPAGTLNHCCICDDKSRKYACQNLAPIVNRGDVARRQKECRRTGHKYGLRYKHVIGSNCGEDGHGNCKHHCWPAPEALSGVLDKPDLSIDTMCQSVYEEMIRRLGELGYTAPSKYGLTLRDLIEAWIREKRRLHKRLWTECDSKGSAYLGNCDMDGGDGLLFCEEGHACRKCALDSDHLSIYLFEYCRLMEFWGYYQDHVHIFRRGHECEGWLDRIIFPTP